MPLVTVHTYKNSAVLVSATINGAGTVYGVTENYTVVGTLSNGATVDLSSTASWSITSGNSYASIDGSGVLTNNNINDGAAHPSTIQAVVSRGDVALTITKVVSVTQRPDPNFAYNVILFPCDTQIPLVSTTIVGDDSMNNGATFNYSVQGTLQDSRIGPMDDFTVWSIISGNSYGTIDSTYGIVTLNQNIEGNHSMTIQATTTYNNNVVTSTKDIVIYGIQDSMMFSGDSTATIVSATISGSSSLYASNTYDYSVSALLSTGVTNSVDNLTTWDITAGGAYASINSSTGVVTVQSNFTGIHTVTIRATVTFNEAVTVTTSNISVYGTDTDQNFAYNTMMFGGDTAATLVSTTISGSSSLSVNNVSDYSVSGTLSDGRSGVAVDNLTTWDITVGSAYASINSSTGTVTVNSDVVGNKTVTIRATTTFNGNSTISTYNIQIAGLFEMLFAGDMGATITSNTISGSTTIDANSTSDYSVTGTFSSGVTFAMDSYTTWDITVGGAYGSINSSSGLLTIGAVTGIHTITVRASTTFDSTTVTSTFNVTVYGTDVDRNFTSVTMLFAGNQ